MTRWTGLSHTMARSTASDSLASTQAYFTLYRQMLQHSAMLAYVDIIYFLAISSACMVPLALYMRKRPAGTGAVMAH